MIPDIVIYQVCAAAFAVVLAKHNAPAVIHFENFGATPLEIARFHRYNVWVKSIFCITGSLLCGWNWLDMLFAGVLSGLWIWLLFDPALNKNRPGLGWDYIGENDADGRRWVKWFGKNAGECKAIILFALIAAGNFLKLKII